MVRSHICRVVFLFLRHLFCVYSCFCVLLSPWTVFFFIMFIASRSHRLLRVWAHGSQLNAAELLTVSKSMIFFFTSIHLFIASYTHTCNTNCITEESRRRDPIRRLKSLAFCEIKNCSHVGIKFHLKIWNQQEEQKHKVRRCNETSFVCLCVCVECWSLFRMLGTILVLFVYFYRCHYEPFIHKRIFFYTPILSTSLVFVLNMI